MLQGAGEANERCVLKAVKEDHGGEEDHLCARKGGEGDQVSSRAERRE